MSASNSKVSTRVCLYLFSINSERNIQKNKHNKTHSLRTRHHMWPGSEYIICDPLHRRWVEVSLCSANGFSICLVQLWNAKYIEVSNLTHTQSSRRAFQISHRIIFKNQKWKWMFQIAFKSFGNIYEVDNWTVASKYYLFSSKSALTTVNLSFASSEILQNWYIIKLHFLFYFLFCFSLFCN